MVQDSAAASQPYPAHTQPHEKGLILSPDSDGIYRCKYCPKGYPCPEPYMFHVAAKHSNTDTLSAVPDLYDKSSAARTSTAEDINHVTATRLDVRKCHGVWCWDGTHYVRVNASQSLGPDSTIQQVDEDKSFTVEEFFQTEFSRTEPYDDTVKRIEELNRTCCCRPVEATTTASTAEHPRLNAGIDSVCSGFTSLVNWFGLCFFPTQRRPGHWNISAWHPGPDSQRASLHSSKEAIIPDTRHGSNTDINTYSGSSDLEGDMRHHMSTANLSAPKHAAFDDMLSLAQTNTEHTSCGLDAFVPEKITAVVAVDSFHANRDGVYGHGVIVLDQLDNVSLLPRVHFEALTKCERIARQVRYVIGEPSYDEVSRFQGKHIDIQGPIYCGLLPEMGSQIQVGEEIPMEQCHPIVKAQIQSIMGV